MRHAKGGILILLLLAILGGLVAYGYHKLTQVFVIRVATGPSGSFGAQFATSLVHLVALDHPRVRISSTATASDSDALKAIDEGRADVAIARSDAGPPSGLTIAVLRHDAALFIVPHTSKADSVPGLRGEALAIVGTSPHDAALLDVITKEYGLTLHAAPVAMAPEDIAEALKAKTIQGVFVVAAPSGKTMNAVLAAVRKGGGGQPKVIQVDLADTIVKRNHLLESVDLPKGVLQGQPPLPDDDGSTLGVSTRLFGTSRMPEAVAAELTRMLLTDKPKVAALLPSSSIIEPPETDKLNASLPIHPGTSDYLTGNQPSLSDEAQNALYWVGIVGSLMASCAAGLAALWRKLAPRRPEATLKMLDLWVAARDAPDEAALATVERDMDAIVQGAIRRQAEGKDDEVNAALPLIVGQVRRAIDRRRDEMGLAKAPRAAGRLAESEFGQA
ncbi:MAG: TAXI family TRAP transporter solute-binding subunit [Alsobacter sp.]